MSPEKRAEMVRLYGPISRATLLKERVAVRKKISQIKEAA